MSDRPNGNRILGKILLGAIVVDLIWAIIVATFGITVLGAAGSAAGASGTALAVGGVLGWIIGFVIAFIQGAIFMVVFAGFAFGALLLFGPKKKS
jgi:hypothetical protein